MRSADQGLDFWNQAPDRQLPVTLSVIGECEDEDHFKPLSSPHLEWPQLIGGTRPY